VFLEADNMKGLLRQFDSNKFGQMPLGIILGTVQSRINWENILNFESPFEKFETKIPQKRVEIRDHYRKFNKEEIELLGDIPHDDMEEPKPFVAKEEKKKIVKGKKKSKRKKKIVKESDEEKSENISSI